MSFGGICGDVFVFMCCIYMLRSTPRVQRLVTTDLVQLLFFCQPSPLLFNISSYFLSHSVEVKTEQDKLQIAACVGFNSTLDPSSGSKVITVLLMKTCCSCSWRDGKPHHHFKTLNTAMRESGWEMSLDRDGERKRNEKRWHWRRRRLRWWWWWRGELKHCQIVMELCENVTS